MVLQFALGVAIGFSLGLLGGGGSILTVPALVYLVGQPPNSAIAASLVIVGANSATGAMFHHRQGTLNWRVAAIFGGAGMVAAYLSAGLTASFSPAVILILFALLMLIIGIALLRKKENKENFITKSKSISHIIGGGIIVGTLTGLLGVGGGFLIVPALTMLVGLPMHTAVGTSLAIIAANSLAGFLGHLKMISLDPTLTLTFVFAGLIGSFAGVKLSSRISSYSLQRIFAAFVIALALFILYDNVTKLF